MIFFKKPQPPRQPEKGTIVLELKDWASVSEEGELLQDVNFDLRAGETHAILSTYASDEWSLVHLFQNRLHHFTGRYTIAGRPYQASMNTNDLIQVVETETAVSCSISAAEQIFLSRRMPRITLSRDLLGQALELMRKTGIHIDLTKPLSSMSRGELRCVEILHLCAMRPQIAVFLDTMTFMTSPVREQLPGTLDYLHSCGCGVIYITNNFEDALRISDRLSVLDSGTIRGTFNTERVREDPREVAGLLSGWKKIAHGGPSTEALPVMESIANMGSIITSEHELRRVLEYILKDMTKAMDASASVFYMLENGRMSILDTSPVPHTALLSTQQVLQLSKRDREIVLKRGSPEFARCFGSEQVAQLVICYPIYSTADKIALVQVSFHHSRRDLVQLGVYLKMFAKELTIAIETSRLLGNSVLLQESHHRIKNNLQTIVNLLYLQKTPGLSEAERGVNDILETAIKRVKSIAYVHTLLCRNWYGKNVVNLKSIICEIIRLYDVQGVAIEASLEDLTLPYHNAVDMALVINELISNCIKHAFAPGSSGNTIHVTMKNTGKDIILLVRDNGCGLPRGFSLAEAEGVGFSIVTSIVSSLHGAITCHVQQGTEVIISFPRPLITPIVARAPEPAAP